jgi:hypothetical protein
MTEKKKKLSDIPIGIRAEEALKKAVADRRPQTCWRS